MESGVYRGGITSVGIDIPLPRAEEFSPYDFKYMEDAPAKLSVQAKAADNRTMIS